MKIYSYLIATTSPELRSRFRKEDDIVTVAILPADVTPTKEILAEELKKTLKHSLREQDYDLIPSLTKPDSITWFDDDIDCPPGCSSVHLACYQEYRKDFDRIAPNYPNLWVSYTGVKDYPFGL